MTQKLIAVASLIAAAAAPAYAKEHQVSMLNRGSDGAVMVFEPAFLKVEPGDTVRFIAVTKGHNAESIPRLTPGPVFKGRMNEEILVRFDQPGLYGYKCLPHYAMGMVGIIQVGSPVNREAFANGVKGLPTVARDRLLALAGRVR